MFEAKTAMRRLKRAAAPREFAARKPEEIRNLFDQSANEPAISDEFRSAYAELHRMLGDEGRTIISERLKKIRPVVSGDLEFALGLNRAETAERQLLAVISRAYELAWRASEEILKRRKAIADAGEHEVRLREFLDGLGADKVRAEDGRPLLFDKHEPSRGLYRGSRAARIAEVLSQLRVEDPCEKEGRRADLERALVTMELVRQQLDGVAHRRPRQREVYVDEQGAVIAETGKAVVLPRKDGRFDVFVPGDQLVSAICTRTSLLEPDRGAGRPREDDVLFFGLRLAEVFTILTGAMPAYFVYDHKRLKSLTWVAFLRTAFRLCGLGTIASSLLHRLQEFDGEFKLPPEEVDSDFPAMTSATKTEDRLADDRFGLATLRKLTNATLEDMARYGTAILPSQGMLLDLLSSSGWATGAGQGF